MQPNKIIQHTKKISIQNLRRNQLKITVGTEDAKHFKYNFMSWTYSMISYGFSFFQ